MQSENNTPMTKLTPEQIKDYGANLQKQFFVSTNGVPNIPKFRTVEEIKLHNQMCVDKINQLKEQASKAV